MGRRQNAESQETCPKCFLNALEPSWFEVQRSYNFEVKNIAFFVNLFAFNILFCTIKSKHSNCNKG